MADIDKEITKAKAKAKENLPIFVVINVFPKDIMSTSDWTGCFENFTEWFERQHDARPGSVNWYVGKYRPIDVPEYLDVVAVDSLDTAMLLKLSMPEIVVDIVADGDNQDS